MYLEVTSSCLLGIVLPAVLRVTLNYHAVIDHHANERATQLFHAAADAARTQTA